MKGPAILIALVLPGVLGSPRNVHLVLDCVSTQIITVARKTVGSEPRLGFFDKSTLDNPALHQPEAKRYYQTHAMIHIAGNETQDTLRLSMRRDLAAIAPRFQLTAQSFGRDPQFFSPTATRDHRGGLRHVENVGQTELGNDDFVESRTGKGILLDTWLDGNERSLYTSGVHSCNPLARDLIRRIPGLKVETLKVLLDDSLQYYGKMKEAARAQSEIPPLTVYEDLPMRDLVLTVQRGMHQRSVRWDLRVPRQPALVPDLLPLEISD